MGKRNRDNGAFVAANLGRNGEFWTAGVQDTYFGGIKMPIQVWESGSITVSVFNSAYRGEGNIILPQREE